MVELTQLFGAVKQSHKMGRGAEPGLIPLEIAHLVLLYKVRAVIKEPFGVFGIREIEIIVMRRFRAAGGVEVTSILGG